MTHATLHTQLNPFAQQRAVKQREVAVMYNVFFLCVAIVFAFLYIAQTSTLSTRGYKIAELEKEKTELSRENQKLDVQIAQERSLNRVLARVNELNMVPLSAVAYANPTQHGLVALR